MSDTTVGKIVFTDSTEFDHADPFRILQSQDDGRNRADYWRQCYEAATRREEQIAQVLQETRNSYIEARAECDKLRAIKNELASEAEEAYELLTNAEDELAAALRTIHRLTQLFVTDETVFTLCDEEDAN